MYHPVSIDGLSNAQINKLIAGHPVRVKAGKHHKIAVSAEQHKKLSKAHMKGKGVTIMMDPYQQSQHAHLKGHGIMSALKKAAGHARTAYGHAKSAIGHASRFYGENKETLEPYANILKKQAHHKIEHISEKAQPHLSKHLGEFGTHLGSHASRVAHENIESFGELEPEMSMVHESELEGLGLIRKHKRSMSHLKKMQGVASSHPGMQGGKINIGKVLSKASNMAVSGAKSYLKSDAGRQLVNRGITSGLTSLAGATGQPELLMAQPMVSSMANRAISGLGMHKKRGRPRKNMGVASSHPRSQGGALIAAGYGQY